MCRQRGSAAGRLVCVRVCAGGVQLQFPSSSTPTYLWGGGFQGKLKEGGRNRKRRGGRLHGGGHVRNEMKETAAGYRANEWPHFPSVIEI